MDLDPRLRPGQGSPTVGDDWQEGAAATSSSSSSPSASPPLRTWTTTTTAAAVAGEGQDGGAAHDAARKPRACEACRGLKVRCSPGGGGDDDGPCKRCRKAGRSCVTTAPTRKRQKKTDSRVLELERKIDALTASLQARGSVAAAAAAAGGSGSSSGGSGSSVSPGAAATAAIAASQHAHRPAGGGGVGPARGETGGRGREQQHHRQPHQEQRQHRLSAPHEPAAAVGHKRKAAGDGSDDGDGDDDKDEDDKDGDKDGGLVDTRRRSPSPVARPSDGDIVDRGLVSAEKAAALFARYKESMVRHMPAVVFPARTTSAELRRTRPYLFLAIMAAAASETHALQRALHRELMQLFAYKIVVAGEKNLELVQALHVAVVWYWPPEHFEELKFYQLVHMAAVMALDIGLGKPRAPARRGIPPFSWREAARAPDGLAHARPDAQPDPASLECRRAWLACHFFAANTAMSLHRPHLIRWSSFMTESLDLLASSPDAAPTDRYLCHLVWTHRKGEEIGIQFAVDDPGAAPVSLTDARTQYALKALERDLDKYRASVADELLQPTLKTSFHLLSLYMHELVLHSNTSTEQIRPPYNTDYIRDGMVRRAEPLSAAHVDALAACLAAIAGILDTFLAMDVPAIRCLPVFNFVRVAYAVVVLMKMFFSAADPRFELGGVIARADLRVDFYLDALLCKFRLTAADDRCRPAAKFLVVLVMLRTWFVKQGRPDADDAPPDRAPTPDPPRPSLNTPLQVLSEVAMGRESAAPSRPVLEPLPDIRPGPAHLHPRSLFHDALSSSAAASTSSPSGPTANYTPSAANMGPASSASSSLGPPAAGPFPAPWMGQQQQQQQQQQPPHWDPLAGLPPGLGLELESLGLPLDSYDAYAGDARMILNEPWFADVFQGLPDPSVFPF